MAQRSRNLLGVGGHRLDLYAGPWAMKVEQALGLKHFAESIDLQLHLGQQAAQPKRRSEPKSQEERPFGFGYGEQLVDGIAVIQVSGVLMKFVSSLDDGTSTVELRNVLRKAVRAENVRGILLNIDSPGGTVSGTESLANDIARFARQKPIHAYFDDLAASAALWIGTQASVISCNATAVVGSIGTYMLVYDLSRLAEKEGVEAVMIRAGEPYKGAGAPGTVITEEQRAKWQEDINALNEHFLKGVARGRNLSIDRVRQLNTGEIWVGEAARRVGLVDHIESIDKAMARLRDRINGGESASRSSASSAASVAIAFDDDEEHQGADTITDRITSELRRMAASGQLRIGSHQLSLQETAMSKNETATSTTAPAAGAAAPQQAGDAAANPPAASTAAPAPAPAPAGSASPTSANQPGQPAQPSQTGDAPAKAATLAQLKAEFADDPAFVITALEKGETLEQAKNRHRDLRLAQLEEENKNLKAQLEAASKSSGKPQAQQPSQEKTAGAKPAGVPRIEDRTGTTTAAADPRAEIDRLVAEEQKLRPELSRREAALRVQRRHPDLFEALRSGAA